MPAKHQEKNLTNRSSS